MKLEKKALIFGIPFAIALATIIIVNVRLISNVQLKYFGKNTEAIVFETFSSHGDKYLKYRFNDGNSQYEDIDSANNEKIGDKVNVTYLPSNPNISNSADVDMVLNNNLWFLILSVLILTPAFISVIDKMYPHQEKELEV